MRRRSIVLVSTALGLALMVAPVFGQWNAGQTQTGSAGYDNSTLMQTPSGGMDPNQPPVYYPYWSNYLDKMQQEGGYYSVTGNYPGSAPVTSYYPSSQYSEATSPQGAPGQSNMYYNPSEYYANQGAPAYQAPQVQTYQAPGSPGQAVTNVQQSAPATGKKRRLKAKRGNAQDQQQAAYQQSPYQQPQQVDPQAYAQQQAYQQQLQAYQQQQAYAQQQAIQQQQAGYPQQQAYPQQQQAYQQPGAYPAGQDANYQQPGYGQAPQQGPQPQAGEAQAPYGSDPTVQAAQQKAYERAVARQRAAELAAQQQAATQELTQAQQQFEVAQQKVREQEVRQKALQAEYHKKAVSDAYDGLRVAQQKYYELMGVSGDSGRPTQSSYQARAVPQGQQQALQYPQMAPSQQPQPQAQQQYGQPGAPPAYQSPQGQYASQPPATAMPAPQQGVTPLQAPPGQATPLRVQGQEQQQADSGGGFWGTLKEIFSSPTTTGPAPNPRSMFDGRGKGRYSD
jgi:hypothetical protein